MIKSSFATLGRIEPRDELVRKTLRVSNIQKEKWENLISEINNLGKDDLRIKHQDVAELMFELAITELSRILEENK